MWTCNSFYFQIKMDFLPFLNFLLSSSLISIGIRQCIKKRNSLLCRTRLGFAILLVNLFLDYKNAIVALSLNTQHRAKQAYNLYFFPQWATPLIFTLKSYKSKHLKIQIRPTSIMNIIIQPWAYLKQDNVRKINKYQQEQVKFQRVLYYVLIKSQMNNLGPRDLSA